MPVFYNQQFKLCYCPVVMKNVILEFERRDCGAPKCLNSGCTAEKDCPYADAASVPADKGTRNSG